MWFSFLSATSRSEPTQLSPSLSLLLSQSVTCFPEGFCSVLDGTLPDARVLPALCLVAQAGSQQLGATCRQHRHVSEADTSRDKGYAFNMAKASLDAQATSPGAVATTRHAHHCLRRCALFREALDRVPRRCSGTPRGQPLVLPCWQAHGDQHWRQYRGATRNCQVHYRGNCGQEAACV